MILKIIDIKVILIVGYDSMLLNLSGVYGFYFMRNLFLMIVDNGEIGVGEVLGGKNI